MTLDAGAARFERELAVVREDVLRLAALAEETIPRGTEILLRADLVGAQQLIEDDDDVDALTMAIEDRCDGLLTDPDAISSQLRELVIALRLTSEIERSADLMVNVAKATRRLYGTDLPPRVSGLIERMSEEAARLFRLAVDAYADRNVALAAALDDMDDGLDELSHDFVHAVFDAHEPPESLELRACVQLALIGRFYERIGDHAVNISERVQNLMGGWSTEPDPTRSRSDGRSPRSDLMASSVSPAPADGPGGRG